MSITVEVGLLSVKKASVEAGWEEEVGQISKPRDSVTKLTGCWVTYGFGSRVKSCIASNLLFRCPEP